MIILWEYSEDSADSMIQLGLSRLDDSMIIIKVKTARKRSGKEEVAPRQDLAQFQRGCLMCDPHLGEPSPSNTLTLEIVYVYSKQHKEFGRVKEARKRIGNKKA